MIENPSEKDEIYLANVAKIGNSIENIQYIENVLPKEEHQVLLNYAKNTDSWKEEPWLARIVESENLPKEIIEILSKTFELVHKKSVELYDVSINPLSKGQIHMVKFVKGFYLVPHTDTLSSERNHIASVYYINDDYAGGEIYFPDHDLTIKPKANSLIVFPGNEYYVHGVSEIIDNNRYSSAMWFQFTGSTFNKQGEWYN
jgi:Rps23 Pro-64 3,4-dihydroxylase Tpa1-like proline 4-hydroxylase